MRRLLWVIVAAGFVFAGCGDVGTDESTDSTRAQAGRVESTSTSTPATTATTAATTTTSADELLIERFVDELAAGRRAALDMTAPGTSAHLYVEAFVLLQESAPSAKAPVQKVGSGWRLGEVTLDQFVIADGMVASLSRNGKPIDSVVAPGDGTEYAGSYYDFEQRTEVVVDIVGKVHSFRYFDGNLSVIATTVNSSTSHSGSLGIVDYVVGGRQYSNAFGTDVLPGASQTYRADFKNVAPGGVLYGHLWVDNRASDNQKLAIQVPSFA